MPRKSNVVDKEVKVELSKKEISSWQIDDCLQFLKRKPDLHTLEIIGDYRNLEWNVVLNWEDVYKGKTTLDALSKSVLGVLEEPWAKSGK